MENVDIKKDFYVRSSDGEGVGGGSTESTTGGILYVVDGVYYYQLGG